MEQEWYGFDVSDPNDAQCNTPIPPGVSNEKAHLHRIRKGKASCDPLKDQPSGREG